MKRIFAVLAAFGLLFSSSSLLAQTVPEQARAPKSVRATYQSETGKSVFQIDAEVVVPQALAAYLIPVERALPGPQALDLCCQALWPGLSFQSQDKVCLAGENRLEVFHRLHIDRQAGFRIDAFVHRYVDTEGRALCGSLEGAVHPEGDGEEASFAMMPPFARVEGEGIPGHPLCARAAEERMAEMVRKVVGGDFALSDLGVGAALFQGDTPPEGERGLLSYVGVFTRMVEGMPLHPIDALPFDPEDRQESHAGYESVRLCLDERGEIASFLWIDPCLPGEAKSLCELLPFERILKVAERIMPLTQARQEAYREEIELWVDRIQLGYLALLRAEGEGSVLTPTWIFYGGDSALLGARDVDQLHTPLLAINAVNGMVVDLDQGY